MPCISKLVTYTNLFIQDCDDSSHEKTFRCTTCISPGNAVSNVCANPENTAALSDLFSARCSSGQLYPEPQRIWPLKERDRFINEQRKLGGLKEGDAGNYLAQPVAATPEIDFTGFKDQTADSVQAGTIPGDDDWTVWLFLLMLFASMQRQQSMLRDNFNRLALTSFLFLKRLVTTLFAWLHSTYSIPW